MAATKVASYCAIGNAIEQGHAISANCAKWGNRLVKAAARRVFEGATFTYEDDRFRYQEQRFVTLGLLEGIPVSIAHTETRACIHIISFRKATKRETAILFENL